MITNFNPDLVSECCGSSYAISSRLQTICGVCGNDCKLVSEETYEKEMEQVKADDLWNDAQNEIMEDSVDSDFIYEQYQ